MAGNKRTIISSKRLRNRRRKAWRQATAAAATATTALAVGQDGHHSAPENDVVATIIPTATDISVDCSHSNRNILPAVTLHLDMSPDSPSAMGRIVDEYEGPHEHDESDYDEGEGGDHDGEEEEDDLVFVCRPTVENFCTEYVLPSEDIAFARGKKTTLDLNKFTVRIPSFRETRRGYVTYILVVNTCHSEQRKHFELERRFSEFVCLAEEINAYLKFDVAASSSNIHSTSSSSSSSRSSARSFQWNLPPKTWFKVMQEEALEERRQKLETCLQDLLSQEEGRICRLPMIRDFFMLDIFGAQVMEEKQQGLIQA